MIETLASQWLTALQNSGARITAPRRAIVERLASSDRALGPLELFEQGRKDYPGLGLVTVYRTLETLEELGLVQRVHQPGGCHMYLRTSRGHEHLLVCTSCGKAVFFSGDDLEPLIRATSQGSGYHVREHWLQLYGTCPACQCSGEE